MWGDANTPISILYDDPILLKSQWGRPVPAGRLGALPPKCKVAFEFRHDSWCDDEIYSILRERDAPICLSDTDEVSDPNALVIPTASWGYLRLRRTEYDDKALADWAQRVEKQPWSEAYVFFKHEDEARGPLFAEKFRQKL